MQKTALKRTISLILTILILLGILPVAHAAGLSFQIRLDGGSGNLQIHNFSNNSDYYPELYLVIIPEDTESMEINLPEDMIITNNDTGDWMTAEAGSWTEVSLEKYLYLIDDTVYDELSRYASLTLDRTITHYTLWVDDASYENFYFIIFQVGGTPPGETDAPDIENLTNAIGETERINSENYYTSGDRYNGNPADTIPLNAQPNGFYAKMQSTLTSAKGLFIDSDPTKDLRPGISQTEVNEKAEALSTALNGLISRDYVNATKLYETVAKQQTNYDRFLVDKSNYTTTSWSRFETALSDAKMLLDGLYNSNDHAPSIRNIGPLQAGEVGLPEDKILQETADDAADALETAYTELLSKEYVDQGVFWQRNISAMLTQLKAAYDNSTAYETDSYSTFKAAYDAAKGYSDQYGAVTEVSTKTTIDGYQTQAKSLWESYYTGLKSVGEDITVSFRVADNRALSNNPQFILDPQEGTYYNSGVALTDGNVSLQNMVTAAGLTLDAKGDSTNNMYEWLVYLNGVLVRPAGWMTASGLSIPRTNIMEMDWADLLLRDGDEIVLLLAPAPTESYYGWLHTASFDKTLNYLGVLSFGNHVVSVKEGESLALEVSRVSGYQAIFDGNSAPFSGAQILAAKLDAHGKPGAYRTLDGVTDAQGRVTTRLYEAGDYVLVAFNPLVNTANFQYPSLSAAARTTITVTTLDGGAMTAAKAEQAALLDKLMASLDEQAIGPDKWAEIKDLIQAGKTAINGADSLQSARDAVVGAETQITALVDAANSANELAVKLMTHYLSLLPTVEQINAGLFMQRDVSRMQLAIDLFGEMTEYQKAQLTGVQMEQWNALKAAYGTDGSALPANNSYTITVSVDGGHGADLSDATFTYNYYSADPDKDDIYSMWIRDESKGTLEEQIESTYGLAGEEDISFRIRMPVTDDFRIDRVEVDGPEHSISVTEPTQSRYYYTYYVRFRDNPRSNIAITIYTQSADNINFIRVSAKSALTTAYQGYSKANYSNTNWNTLTQAYNVGLAAIDAAADSSAITGAKNSAVSAMAAVKTLAQEASAGQPETVGTHGTAHVIIENTTYSHAISGTIAEADVPLNGKSTMMTASLDALKKEGYSWTGTGGSKGNVDDDTITYLASISRGGATLGEFSGTSNSGWMGTLNDWFVNEGFQSFSVSAANKNYLLSDGDQIRVMFTDDLGADLGGTWNNPDTSLKSLTNITGGTLAPSFKSGVTEYILNLGSGGNTMSFEPTAANKNYQVRTYLNRKTGDNWYRGGESISVKPGDVVYIGVGDLSWPSMNNQGAEAISYSGTWYTITITDSGNADGVIKMINALPTITYANYKAQAENVALARNAYNALTEEAKRKVSQEVLKKLTDKETDVGKFKAIDNVKSLLDAIPAADKLTTADKSKVQAAYDEYSKLNDEQRKYITVGDSAKYNAAVGWLKQQGIDTPGSIVGSDKAPGEEAVVIAPKVTAKDGVAAASVSASDMSKAIDDAKKNGSGAIVIEPEISGKATKTSVELPKASVSSMDSGTSADLKIVTPNGSVTIPHDALASVASQATGSAVTIVVEAVETKSLTAEQQKTVGDGAVFDISILSNGKPISGFGGKSIAISLPYTLKNGETPEGVTVWYLSDAGKLERVSCKYDKDTGLAAFTAAHLSNYVVGYDAWTNPFTDVKAGDWFYDAVKYATQKELFNGTSATAFGPNTDMTRAMLVTVLYRLEGKPAVTAANPFADVEGAQWYTDAVLWANLSGIVTGYDNGLFGTNDPITREQMAVILYRYAAFKKYDTVKTNDLGVYADGGSTASYALSALKWANAEGLITGRTATALAPSGTATRAEVATILMRVVENVAK